MVNNKREKSRKPKGRGRGEIADEVAAFKRKSVKGQKQRREKDLPVDRLEEENSESESTLPTWNLNQARDNGSNHNGGACG